MARQKSASADPAKRLVVEKALLKLAASDLTLEDADRLRIDLLTAPQAQALGFKALPALKINYYDPVGRPLADWPQHPPFYRVRYLDVVNDFAKVTEAKPARYTQPPNTVCCAYFPQNQAWDLLLDPAQPLILTEGELKAACACKHGFPTVGLGGVYNWRSLPKGVELLPELARVKWVGRHVYICFDSDYLTNPLVCAALRELADQLVDLGAYPYVVTLPALAADQKTGLDDLLVAEGPAALEQLLHQAQALGLTKPLFDLNQKYVYVASPGLVVKQQGFSKTSPAAFKEHVEAAKTYQERVLKPDGTVSHRPVAAAAAWLSWPLRFQASKLTYRPGGPALDPADHQFNIWPGWGCEAAKGDVAPFLALVDHLFQGAEPAAKEWFLSWCACPLQRPGLKMFSSAVLHGVRHGTGKSLVGYTLGRIYGQNFVEISQADLHASFNEWAEAKQFVLGDDVTGSNKRQDADMLKKLITQKEIRVNVKYVPSYVVPDCINYLFTSNHPDAFFLEDDDRRFFIHEVVAGPLPDAFYQSYAAWLAGPGAAAVFHWLLHRDLVGFNPFAAALRTQARERMLADIQSDLGGWVRQLLAAPEALLKVGEAPLTQDLFTSKELLALYDPLGKTGTTANGLGRELRRAGVQPVCGGAPLKLGDGSQARYYPVRGRERWLHATPKAATDHLNQAHQLASPAKPKQAKF